MAVLQQNQQKSAGTHNPTQKQNPGPCFSHCSGAFNVCKSVFFEATRGHEKMRKLLLSIAVPALMTTGALAHSPVVAPEPMTPAPTYKSDGFNWGGFYMGLGISGSALAVDNTTSNDDTASDDDTAFNNNRTFNNNTAFKTGYLDLIVGVNMTADSLLFGLEGWISGFSGDWSNGFGAGAQARLGVLVSPEVLLYLAGGGFIDTVDQYGTIGGGVEFAVTDNVSLDLEYKYWMSLNSAVTGNGIGASLNWGF